MKYLKFLKPHSRLGATEGDVIKVLDTVAEHWLETDYCEECEESDYKKYFESKQRLVNDKKPQPKKVIEVKEETPVGDTKTLDELDFENDKSLGDEGFKVGDLVYVDKNNEIDIMRIEESKELNLDDK